MTNIIAKTGSAIAKHKKEASDILAKYNLANDGSTGDMIKKSFTSIKSGNKDLAIDLAGLVTLDKAHSVSRSSPLAAKNTDILEEIKSRIAAKIAALKTNKESGNSADGVDMAIEADSTELFDTVSKGDVDSLSTQAMKAADSMPVVMIVILIVCIAAIVWLIKKW